MLVAWTHKAENLPEWKDPKGGRLSITLERMMTALALPDARGTPSKTSAVRWERDDGRGRFERARGVQCESGPGNDPTRLHMHVVYTTQDRQGLLPVVTTCSLESHTRDRTCLRGGRRPSEPRRQSLGRRRAGRRRTLNDNGSAAFDAYGEVAECAEFDGLRNQHGLNPTPRPGLIPLGELGLRRSGTVRLAAAMVEPVLTHLAPQFDPLVTTAGSRPAWREAIEQVVHRRREGPQIRPSSPRRFRAGIAGQPDGQGVEVEPHQPFSNLVPPGPSRFGNRFEKRHDVASS